MERLQGGCVAFLALICIIGPVTGQQQLYGVSQIAITVDDLQNSTDMYVHTLGGMLVESLSTTGVWGDELFFGMFQQEILAAEAAGATLDEYGVCDISTNGIHKVAWNFIMFESNMIQLIECRFRDTSEPKSFSRPHKGAAKIATSGHLCLWSHEEVVPVQQVDDILNREKARGNPYAGFITGFDVYNETIRNTLDSSNFLVDMGGFYIGAFRGMVGEHIELSFRRYAANGQHLQFFCENDGVSTLMLRPLQNNAHHDSPSHRTAGFHHSSFTVHDPELATSFYTEVLGGILESSSNIPAGIESLFNVYFQDDIFEAQSLGVEANPTFGVLPYLADPSSGGSSQLTFIFFDNIFIEHYAFSGPNINDTFSEERYLSPGYTRSFVNAFWVRDDVDLNKYVKNMEAKSATMGMPQVKANRPVKVDKFGDTNIPLTDYSRRMNSSGIKGDVRDLEGYSFIYFKGPSGETQALTQFTGSTRDALKSAMLKYGAVSKAFPETDPWYIQGFDTYCQQFSHAVPKA